MTRCTQVNSFVGVGDESTEEDTRTIGASLLLVPKMAKLLVGTGPRRQRTIVNLLTSVGRPKIILDRPWPWSSARCCEIHLLTCAGDISTSGCMGKNTSFQVPPHTKSCRASPGRRRGPVSCSVEEPTVGFDVWDLCDDPERPIGSLWSCIIKLSRP